ncbi:MAG TPA: hypothetical protein VG034_29690 [Acidimicrobiia bacterium]|nr:hypothetical protein [Acidimicrobiia bacterium]
MTTPFPWVFPYVEEPRPKVSPFRARMLLTRAKPGDTEQAHNLLQQALATARDRGLTNIERRAVELLSPQ